jgi:predicted SnoaL-like aldol condensation-catalyzing enzyme
MLSTLKKEAVVSTETNQVLVRRFYEEILTERKSDAVGEIFATDYVCHSSNLPPALPAGIEGMKRFVTEFLSGYPQMRFTVEKQTSEDEKVHSQIVAKSGSPIGPVMSIPADPAKVAASDTITGMSTDRIVNNKIVESWIEFHIPNPLPQLEEMPDKDRNRQTSI